MAQALPPDSSKVFQTRDYTETLNDLQALENYVQDKENKRLWVDKTDHHFKIHDLKVGIFTRLKQWFERLFKDELPSSEIERPKALSGRVQRIFFYAKEAAEGKNLLGKLEKVELEKKVVQGLKNTGSVLIEKKHQEEGSEEETTPLLFQENREKFLEAVSAARRILRSAQAAQAEEPVSAPLIEEQEIEEPVQEVVLPIRPEPQGPPSLKDSDEYRTQYDSVTSLFTVGNITKAEIRDLEETIEGSFSPRNKNPVAGLYGLAQGMITGYISGKEKFYLKLLEKIFDVCRREINNPQHQEELKEFYTNMKKQLSKLERQGDPDVAKLIETINKSLSELEKPSQEPSAELQKPIEKSSILQESQKKEAQVKRALDDTRELLSLSENHAFSSIPSSIQVNFSRVKEGGLARLEGTALGLLEHYQETKSKQCLVLISQIITGSEVQLNREQQIELFTLLKANLRNLMNEPTVLEDPNASDTLDNLINQLTIKLE